MTYEPQISETAYEFIIRHGDSLLEDELADEIQSEFDELDEEVQQEIAEAIETMLSLLNEDEDEEMVEEDGQTPFNPIQDLVTTAINQAPIDFQHALDDIMSAKIEDAIADRKLELAHNLFNDVETEADDEEVQADDEPVEENE